MFAGTEVLELEVLLAFCRGEHPVLSVPIRRTSLLCLSTLFLQTKDWPGLSSLLQVRGHDRPLPKSAGWKYVVLPLDLVHMEAWELRGRHWSDAKKMRFGVPCQSIAKLIGASDVVRVYMR